MPTLNLKAILGFDGKGFDVGMSKANSSAQKLSSKFNGGLKGAIAGAFAVGAITAAAKKTIDFADGIDKGARNLGVTTRYFQILQKISRDTGKDFGVLENAITNVGDALQDALNGDKIKKDALKKAGFSEDDIKNLSPEKAMSKLFGAASGMPRAQGASLLSDLGFKKNAIGSLLSVAPQLANPESIASKMGDQLVDDDKIAAMAELKDQWEDLIATVQGKAVPALSYIIDKVTWFARSVMQLAELAGTAIGAFAGIIHNFNLRGLILSFGENFKNMISAVFDNAIALIRGKKTIGEVLDGVASAYAKGVSNTFDKTFGKENVDAVAKTINDKLLEMAKDDQVKEAAKEERKKQRAQEQGEINADANRVAREEKKEFKNEIRTDSALKVGNYLGATGGMIQGIAQKHLDETRGLRRDMREYFGSKHNSTGSSLSSLTP